MSDVDRLVSGVMLDIARAWPDDGLGLIQMYGNQYVRAGAAIEFLGRKGMRTTANMVREQLDRAIARDGCNTGEG